MSVKLAPSILSADFGRLEEQIQESVEHGADWIHVDVMDGHFVPNITIGPLIAAAARRATDVPIDVHLMIENPDQYLAPFADAGADLISVHVEACPHLHRTVQRIRELGVKAGVALNPATPLSSLEGILPDLDLLVIMSVNPGFGGQAFIPSSTDKVARARSMIDACGNDGIEIEVDGGVDARSAPGLVSAGATVLVAGSAVFGHAEGIAVALERLRAAAVAVPS